MIKYYYQKQTTMPFATVEKRLRTTLSKQGFGIITEIDAQKTMKEKLGVVTEGYKILGACNPKFAHQASTIAPDIGVLLPCNVLIRTEGKKTIVNVIRPTILFKMIDAPALKPLAQEVEKRLTSAINEAVQK